jgi:uncharacterized protein YkwD
MCYASMKKMYLWLFAIIFIVPVSIAQSSLHISDNSFKIQFLDRINDLRQRGCNCGGTFMPPAPALHWSDMLTEAAKGHAVDMAKHHYFSHESRNGRTLRQRALAVGHNYKGFQKWAIGENIAMGQRTIDEVMDGWIESEGHCRNLMSPQFKEIGVFEYNLYWVQDFGGRVSF